MRNYNYLTQLTPYDFRKTCTLYETAKPTKHDILWVFVSS